MRTPNGRNGIEDTDIAVILRAANYYNTALKNHIQGKEHLPEETIEYYTDRLLEITLTLEAVGQAVFDSLSDEEKEVLSRMEKDRNKNLFLNSSGDKISAKDIEVINTCIETQKNYFEGLRLIAKNKIENA